MSKHHAITRLPSSPTDDRRLRMIKYCVAMGARMICIFACFFVTGWWLLVPAIGAVVLPYVAVVIATTSVRSGVSVERPSAIQVYRPEGPR
ncbi:DUF3099 domain-containing protein [Arenivirga flava]|uniref:DUF3099 domain-containing protein n=1 Tax=Arenivirga flava TaxID=1930060 RepID=A0AA37XAK7_9MICO|nr:DUF3099 domain-containing protein [Arenivirga flava]GMA27525.1 hypothetical protein GCM10025874_07780 [Arenivirga flava]